MGKIDTQFLGYNPQLGNTLDLRNPGRRNSVFTFSRREKNIDSVDINSYLIDSISTLETGLSLDAKFSFSLFKSKFHSTLNIDTSTILNEKSLTFLFNSRVIQKLEYVNHERPIRLKDNIIPPTSVDSFKSHYGEHFVDEIYHGSVVYLFITLVFSSKEEKKAIEAKLEAKGGKYKAELDFKQLMQSRLQNSTARINIRMRGINSPNNTQTTLEIDILDALSKYTADKDKSFDRFLKNIFSKTLKGATRSDFPVYITYSPLTNITLFKNLGKTFDYDETSLRKYINYYNYYTENLEILEKMLSTDGIAQYQISRSDLSILFNLRNTIQNYQEELARIILSILDTGKTVDYKQPADSFFETNGTFMKYAHKGLIPLYFKPYPAERSNGDQDFITDEIILSDQNISDLNGRNVDVMVSFTIRSVDIRSTIPEGNGQIYINGVVQPFDYQSHNSETVNQVVPLENIKVPDNKKLSWRLHHSASEGNGAKLLRVEFNNIQFKVFIGN